MSKTALAISLILMLICIAIGIYGAQSLPLLDQYPVHWGADGAPDRFGSRGEAMFTLWMIPAISALTLLLLWIVPKIGPLGENLTASGRAFSLICMAILALFVGVEAMIVKSYLSASAENFGGVSPKLLIAGLAVFYIVIGNVMGNVRRNFFVGFRTPWTLSSDLSWDKTHRLCGRLFVLSGILGLIAIPFISGVPLIILFVSPSLIVSVFGLFYSYRIWKLDPDKRQ